MTRWPLKPRRKIGTLESYDSWIENNRALVIWFLENEARGWTPVSPDLLSRFHRGAHCLIRIDGKSQAAIYWPHADGFTAFDDCGGARFVPTADVTHLMRVMVPEVPQ